MKDTIALIDGDSLIYYEMGKPTLEEALEGIDTRIMHMLNQCKAEKYAGFLTQGKCFRYKEAVSKPYKGNRKYGDKPIIFPAIKEYLYSDPLKTVICSPDKDVLYQNKGINYNYGKAETIIVDENEALRFLWKQVLMGDSTDGIGGIPKVGQKTAEAWLKPLIPAEMPEFVLNKYLEKFGIQEGIYKFTETFKLIYILKTVEEAKTATGIDLPELVTYDVTLKEEELW